MTAMARNPYDDDVFFDRYATMDRSRRGLAGAGEWHVLKRMLPDFSGKDVLDLGCGYGWHCRYAADRGARSVTGVDISEKMLEKARTLNASPKITYLRKPIEEVRYPAEKFDIVVSSLAFHYLEFFEPVCEAVYKWLRNGGSFVFSVEHPVFTAAGNQDWFYGAGREKLFWPVDNYFLEGRRETVFLGERVIKYHRTLAGYLNDLLRQGFRIREVAEPTPDRNMLGEVAEMREELRRPMMLLVSAQK